ncbi:hypothetical protein GALMADRAFT_236367 [Galerina marginata CBS 339.88]|uniref:PABS domain-containing protein n=1 Tax=Galerina marginata (strain CBS 339.88) TaxID=685588 RepID=A0A067TKZ9_GALM3|nr:hypothetical protein GALMADRAFT_236367 [Galerina marginata CBS 339.88]
MSSPSSFNDSKDLGLKAIRFISVLFPLSLVLFTHQRELVPLYGSTPTSTLLDKIAFGAAILSAIHPIRVSLKRNFLYTALALTVAPNATYWIAVWTSRWKDPVLGPAITHVAALGPLVFLLATYVVEMDDSDAAGAQTAERPALILRLLRSSITYMISKALARRMWSLNSILYNVSDSQIYLSLAAISFNLWIVSLGAPKKASPEKNASKKKKNKQSSGSSSFTDVQWKAALLVAFNAFWWTVYPRFSNPILPHPLFESYTHPTYPLRILSAEQSVTGLITVAEWLPPTDYKGENDEQLHSARYLRASHSLLGGVWTQGKVQVLDNEQPIRDSLGNALGDSIYSTFVVQEAVRLVNSTKTGKTGAWANALVIGLGAGISATSFARHDISTTIVEIDPAVYTAARTFFGLPDPGPGKVFLEDARAWAARKRASIENGQKETLFNFVVHDCFSGGGVPEHIFTLQFWSDLKMVMQPDGILVVNFAGLLKSTSSRLIIHTLEKSFGQCRAFHDLFDTLPEEKYDTEFINMVLFCTKSSSPLTFRKPRRSDWLGSPLRRHVLQSLESREVNLSAIRVTSEDAARYILTDQHNPLGALQEKQRNHHWQVMRDVLPNIHWETY